MNARDNSPLRAKIADRLAAGEDTAAGIASAIGKGDTPSIVVKELNAMRTDGQVECEQRGKKKELVYWLAVPLAVVADDYEPEPAPAPATISEVMLPPGVRHGTRAAQIYRVLPLYGAKPMTARQIATATGAALGLISPTLSGMVKAGQVSRVSSGVTEAYGYTRLLSGPETVTQNAQPEVAKNTGSSASGSLSPSEGAAATPSAAPVAADEPQDDDAMPPADASLLALANRELGDRLARVAHVLRGSGLEGLKDLDDGADLQSAAAALTGAYQMALAELHACTGKIADLQHKVSMQDAELFKQAGVVVDLRNQLESLQREAMRGATLLSGDDRYTAAGYLVRAPKRAPRITAKQETAVAAALAAARNGSGRGEVSALVPVGKAVRGAEWRPA
ncbi:hypothetical protein [Thauera sp.]|uniref:hypothetical protein n=1 Tax=Thauera sp. TaxID=1905334 RepID=UPI002C649280|nr:hypothetical protein [Thauera sp.]HRO38066.1 hypothetical protein [Thauera sp.]